MSRLREIERLHGEIFHSLRTSLPKAMRIGELLTEQKAELQHGGWEDWIAENVPFSKATVKNYMALFRERGTLKSLNVSDLSAAYRWLRSKPKSKRRKQAADPVPDERQFTLRLSDEEQERELSDLIQWVQEKVFHTPGITETVLAALLFAKEHGDE